MKWLIILLPAFILALVLFFFLGTTPKFGTVQFVDGPELKVEIMDNDIEHAQGLAGHAPLAEDRGMLFLFDTAERRSFWMKGMTFAIDIIWISDGQVIGITQNIPPPTSAELVLYPSPASVDMVLEVAAGWSERQGIAVGDRLTISK